MMMSKILFSYVPQARRGREAQKAAVAAAAAAAVERIEEDRTTVRG